VVAEAAASWAGEGLRVVRSLDDLPEPPFALCLRNARAASRLLAGLLGVPDGERAFTFEEVESALSARDLHVRRRAEIPDERPRLPLPDAAAAALVALLHAVEPSSRAGWLLLEVAARQPKPDAGLRGDLVSVIVRGDGSGLDRTLFSLACQRLRPLQIVAPRAAAERYAHLGTFELAERAEGRWVAWLAAGDVVYPQHFVELRNALDGSGAAFATSRGRATRERDGYVETKLTEPPRPADVAGLLRLGSLASVSLFFDRTRIPALDVNDPALDASDLALRLLSFCRPAVVQGVPTWERSEQPPGGELPKEMPLLMTLPELERSMASAPAPRWLRYRVADAVSAAWKSISSRWGRP